MRNILLLAAFLAAGPALAQPAPDQAPPPAGQAAAAPAPAPGGGHRRANRFDEANTTHDGKLTLDQAQANRWRPIVKNFAAIDRDHKGYVTKQDLKEFRQERAAERKATQPPAAPPAPNAPPPGPASPPPPAAPDGAPHY